MGWRSKQVCGKYGRQVGVKAVGHKYPWANKNIAASAKGLTSS
jgi:hypothetical protein